MKLTPPKGIMFWILVILGFLGYIGTLLTIPFISAYTFWFLFAGFVLLLLSLLIKGLWFSSIFNLLSRSSGFELLNRL